MVDWWVQDKVFEVGPDCIFITFAGEQHRGLNDIINPGELFWAQLELPHQGCLPGLSRRETASLTDKPASVGDQCFPGTPETPILFRRIVDEHRSSSDHSSVLAHTGLIELSIAVIQGHEVHRRENTIVLQCSRPICAAPELTDQHFAEEIKYLLHTGIGK